MQKVGLIEWSLFWRVCVRLSEALAAAADMLTLHTLSNGFLSEEHLHITRVPRFLKFSLAPSLHLRSTFISSHLPFLFLSYLLSYLFHALHVFNFALSSQSQLFFKFLLFSSLNFSSSYFFIFFLSFPFFLSPLVIHLSVHLIVLYPCPFPLLSQYLALTVPPFTFTSLSMFISLRSYHLSVPLFPYSSFPQTLTTSSLPFIFHFHLLIITHSLPLVSFFALSR